ncbi:MAG: hypothetical protein F6J93_34820 [Oscillatoria sp. SIO1A7]|nr:hypothetical protein [Oscillatoria sp. SIO1A7]
MLSPLRPGSILLNAKSKKHTRGRGGWGALWRERFYFDAHKSQTGKGAEADDRGEGTAEKGGESGKKNHKWRLAIVKGIEG